MRVSTNASAAVSTTSTITASAVATPATITAAAVHSRVNGREDTIQGIEHAEIQVERSEVEAA
jgi:hypothetical protein